MDPISQLPYYYDKYVFQDPGVWNISHGSLPTKPFEIKAPEKSKKTKKDIRDRKNPRSSKENSSG